MPIAQELLDPEHYPEGFFKPLHPIFRGKAKVERHGFPTDEPPFTVNLNTGECSCDHGAAMAWYSDRKIEGKWVPNRYCVHKLKAMADIIQQGGHEQEPGIMFPFMKAVATRYNAFEVVSAFHKELRRGNFNRAYFFACILCTTRGVKGVIKYLNAIIYEETRDHNLRDYLTQLMESGDNSFITMARAITWFCETPKKWDLHEKRIKLFEHEQRGYQRLVKEFGKNVARASEIIDADMVPVFLDMLIPALKKKDYDTFQYALKGIQKSKFPDDVGDLNDLRWQAILTLKPAVRTLPPMRKANAKAFYAYLKRKHGTSAGVSYHDLNAFGDLLSGEPYTYGLLPLDRAKTITRLATLPAFPFSKFPGIPLYAHDNHTYKGKALIRVYGGQAQPNIEQTSIDLRGCGAYMGVAWRYYAMAQKSTVSCKWHEVKIPLWMAQHLKTMWY